MLGSGAQPTLQVTDYMCDLLHYPCRAQGTRQLARSSRGLLSSQTLLSNGASAGFWRTLQHFAHHRIIYSIMEPFLLYIMCEHKLWPVCPRLSRRQSRAFFIPATGGDFCRVVHGGGGSKRRTDHGMPSAHLVDSADTLVKATGTGMPASPAFPPGKPGP